MHEYLTPEDYTDIRRYIDRHRTKKSDYDVVDVTRTEGPDDTEWVSELAEAGVTWLAEVVMEQDLKEVLERVRKGPVKL